MEDTSQYDRLRPLKIYGITFGTIFLCIMAAAFLGFFQTSKDLRACRLPAGLECLDYSLSPTGAVIYVKNTNSDEITIDALNAPGCETLKNVNIGAHSRKKIKISNCKNTDEALSFTMQYHTSQGEKQQALGSVTGTVT